MTAPPRTRSFEHVAYQDGHPTALMATEPDTRDRTEQKFSLSVTQVAASMTAAVTAALVGSRLGVAGTVIGAGLASVISVVGGAIIGHSILLTRNQVKRAVLQVKGTDPVGATVVDQSPTVVLPSARSVPGPAEDNTVVIPVVTRLDLQRASRDARQGPGQAEPGRPRPRLPQGGTSLVLPKTRRRVSTGVLLGVAASLAIFVSALGAVTVAETIKGSPLAGGESGGLTVLGGNGGNPIAPTTTSTSVVTEASTVTQTVTTEVTAPATTAPSPTAPSSATQPQSASTSASTRPSPSTPPSSSQTPASAGATPAAAANSASTATPSPAVAPGQAGQR